MCFLLQHANRSTSQAGFNPKQICERLIDHSLGRDSKDNMTVVLVLFDGAPKPVPGHEAQPIAVLPQAEDSHSEFSKSCSVSAPRVI